MRSPVLRPRIVVTLTALVALALLPGCQADVSGGDHGSGTTGDGGTVQRLPDGRVISTSDGALPPGTCAITRVSTTRVVPTVVVVVDQSGSMTESFGASDRWNALRNALLDEAGLLREFEDRVRFGIALYTGLDEGSVLECPHLTRVAPAMMSYDAIRTVYAAEAPLQETPTGDALDAILDGLLAVPDPDPDPTIFILATDGEPDTCEQPNPQNGQAEALAAVSRAYRAGIRTYLLSVGSDISAEHMQDVANAGVGRTASEPDAPYWVAGDDVGLRDALRTIIAGEVSCTLELAGRIDPAMACEGSIVEMTGRGALECGTEWRAVDETHIEILGDACTEFLESRGATIDARFPCEVILI